MDLVGGVQGVDQIFAATIVGNLSGIWQGFKNTFFLSGSRVCSEQITGNLLRETFTSQLLTLSYFNVGRVKLTVYVMYVPNKLAQVINRWVVVGTDLDF